MRKKGHHAPTADVCSWSGPHAVRAAADVFRSIAQLPQVRLDTTYTAPTGRQPSVPAGGDLQSALSSAQPDAIIPQAGATYSGNFTLPTKSGNGSINVQSSALSRLPGQPELPAKPR